MAVKLNDKIFLKLLPFLIRSLLRMLGFSMRIKEEGNTAVSPCVKKSGNFIYAFWHSRILMSVYYFRNKGINCMVSAGRDGEYIARVMHGMGFKTARGSSSREGVKALIMMKRDICAGGDAAITPDGPRGPKQTVQPGVITLAKMTGVPIATFGFDASRKKVFNSWDNFVLPHPFSKGVFVWGKLIHVPEDADDKTMEEKRLELEEELNRLMKEAGSLCGSA